MFNGKCLWNYPYFLDVAHIVLVISCLQRNTLNFPSQFFFFFCMKKLYLSPDRCSARHSEMYFQKLFTLSSLHPHLYFHSCTAKKWEAVMLTVASLQSLFNGTSIPASPRDADWGKMRRLTVTAGYGRPASCSSYPLCRNLRILSQVGRNIFAFVNSWI